MPSGSLEFWGQCLQVRSWVVYAERKASPSMLISEVQEASGMCCPLCREIACGNLFLAQQVTGGAQCFVQGTPLTPLVLFEHPPPFERRGKARAVFPRFIETQGFTLSLEPVPLTNEPLTCSDWQSPKPPRGLEPNSVISEHSRATYQLGTGQV